MNILEERREVADAIALVIGEVAFWLVFGVGVASLAVFVWICAAAFT